MIGPLIIQLAGMGVVIAVLPFIVCVGLAYWILWSVNVKAKNFQNISDTLIVAIMMGGIPGLILSVVVYMLINYGLNW